MRMPVPLTTLFSVVTNQSGGFDHSDERLFKTYSRRTRDPMEPTEKWES